MNTETLHLILSAGLVAAAAALDVAANLMLARSDGFKKRLIGIAALALVGLAIYCLSLAVQYMDLAVAYSMWGSLGILGTSLCGWLFLRQRLKPCAFAGMGLLIIGMILLRIIDPEMKSETLPDVALTEAVQTWIDLITWSVGPYMLMGGQAWTFAIIYSILTVIWIPISKKLGWWYTTPLDSRGKL